MDDANRDRYLTGRWNNVLAVLLGLPILAVAFVGLTGDAMSDQVAFIGLVVLSAFY